MKEFKKLSKYSLTLMITEKRLALISKKDDKFYASLDKSVMILKMWNSINL